MSNFTPQIEQVQKQIHEIEQKLNNAETFKDQNLSRDLNRLHSRLTGIIQLHNQYEKVLADFKQADEMRNDADPDIAQMAELESDELDDQCKKLEKEVLFALVPPDPKDDKNTIIEIRAGTGGEEAALFSGALFRMYARYSERVGWKLEVLNTNETGLGGFKEIVFSISGQEVYSNLKFESGTHRVQRVPETEAQGRIHTSAVTVAVLPEAEDVDIQIRNEDIKVDTFCASGPGGQHVNRTESAIRITHLPTGVVVSCQDEKSQHKNKARAMKVLRARLYDIEEQKRADELGETRRQQVGSGDRSERIRTYNFPQNRLSDHRINLTLYKLDMIMEGDLDELFRALRENDLTRKLEAQAIR
jgi:peptide chain release factor 1